MAEPDIPTLIADLKITIVQGHIRQIMEHGSVMGQLASISSTLEHFKEKIEDIHKEVVKNPVSEYFEAAGLDGIAAGIEKLYEGEGFGTAFKYWGSTVVGGMVALLIGALTIYLSGKFVALRRSIQELISRDGLIRGYDANGDLTRQSRTDIEARERRVANGGTSLADLPPGTNLGPLQTQLELLIPKIEKFNSEAPSFLTNFRKLPSERAMTKTATGIGKVSDAVAAAKPTDIEKVADATEKLVAAQSGFDPRKLPKARGLASAAEAAERLARAGDDVKTAFDSLKAAAQSAERVIAAG
ncbi:hypothetical protein OG462_26125 [Streptomyces sp. NBC_01077]|uniref:hypothetical protein n=1 Tax=Streptomyces sp. NBC_01077 TaxID=2903746 RepID=UPI0038641353|nr:hypothetical protein OG462_26125 [Streptomyces sp. NBC_01077]